MKKFVLLLIVLLSATYSLWSTWSIIAIDPETGEVGTAGASYTPSVWPILGISGGHGVLVAQAAGNDGLRARAVKMLEGGASADAVMAVVTDGEVNPGMDNQQWAVLSSGGGHAQFTGSECSDWAGHGGNETVLVQGNILVSEAVVADTLAAYGEARTGGMPMAEALVTAMAAGSAAGGDRRAPELSMSAMTAYVAVAQPGDPPQKPSFALIVPPVANNGNPVTELQRLYADSVSRGVEVKPLFFPSLAAVLLSIIGAPVLLGLSSFFFLRRIINRAGAVQVLIGAGTLILAIAFQKIIQFGLGLFGWALPVYGYYKILMPSLAAALLFFLLVISGVVLYTVRRVRQRTRS